ncbi:SUKH-4 family immunity protein [Kitasatospora sp. YST-16]|uniref:SUKH-4 family immunity protein n=1 Tax=Kitasatospora sp. YST-16 TaxID=2998080 RepID=UPI002284C96B|nr:SUKH-4 family immunity protein [Kitasatospora sp. YST-16]WAL75826.1 SUKH-4 family immunity protein [Kitasatospora sp. YST-16]WNW41884.1 SUKH-4 family immunity protein [Streptomyces sp. Li-HN-5-13]
MTGRDEAAVETAVETLVGRLQDGGPGLVVVRGAAGSGRSAVLGAVAERFRDAVLVDAAGRSADSVAAELIDRIRPPQRRRFMARDTYGDLTDLVLGLRQDSQPRTVLVANAELAGSLRSGGEPQLMRQVLDTLRIAAEEGWLRLVVERSASGPRDERPSNRAVTVVELPGGAGPEEFRALEEAVSPEVLGALRALANGQLWRAPVAAWAQLCAAAEVPYSGRELAELPWLAEDEDGIGFVRPALAEQLRYEGAEAAAFHRRMTDLLIADGPAEPWALRSLPGHAAAAGRFDELLADPALLARIPQEALLEAFRACYPDGIERGTHAAALHFLSGYGLAGAPHGEWVAWLAHDAFTRGDVERAEALAEASPEPLPFRTVWSRWRAPGDFTPPTEPGHQSTVELVDPAEFDGVSVVVTEGSGSLRLVRDAATGRLLAALTEESAESEKSRLVMLPADSAALNIRANYNVTAVLPPGADRKAPALGVFHHPDADWGGAVGDLLVLAGAQGAYAVRLDVDLLREGPEERLRSLLGGDGFLLPKPFDPAEVADARSLLERAFGPERIHRLAADELPAGITHEPTRRLLTEVGVPKAAGLVGLWLTPHEGLPVRAWESTADAEQPPGSGPFHLIGDWMGAPLLLDGSDGRVLRMLNPQSPDYTAPREPLVGSSLESFVTMVALEKQYLEVYRTEGPDTYDVLEELQTQVAGVDRAAAGSDVWQYALESDNWGD